MNRTHYAVGFTLIEVMLAITLSGVAVLVGSLLWRQSLSASAFLLSHREAVDRQEGARRWLHSAIGSIDIGATGDQPFIGRSDQVGFSTWLPTAGGWPERQSITISASGGALTAAGALNDSLRLVDSVASVEFDYLLEPGLNSTWASSWESPVSAPLAVRVRIDYPDLHADTLLFLVGGRG